MMGLISGDLKQQEELPAELSLIVNLILTLDLTGKDE